MWGDSTATHITCSDDNRTIFRSAGGFYIYTNSWLTSGMFLDAGGSSWNVVSDRTHKENFRPVDRQELLECLAAIPTQTWNYKSQDPSIRHIGPMADEFNALVEGLGGEGANYINSLDAGGVALAAIQGLYQQNQQLQAENAELSARVTDLETRLAALEQQVGGASAPASAVPNAGLAFGGLTLLSGVVYWRRKEGGRQ